MSTYIILILALIFLFIGGELLVRGSVSLSLKMKISTLVVGMTIVSFATSTPELFVSLQAVFDGSSNIAFGNVIGSNIANITLVLGITAIICNINISKKTTNLNFPMLFFSSVFLGFVLYFFKGITFWIGVIFVVLLLLFSWILISNSRKEKKNLKIHQDELIDEVSNDSKK